ncbi:MAG: hypothetical protein ACOVMP_01170 [Chthoniobacterales bacterium]
MIKSLFTYLGLAVLVIALPIIVWAYRTGRLEPPARSDQGVMMQVASDALTPPGVIPVTLGVYVEKIYNFTIQSQAFSSEGWVWLIWPQEFQDLLDAEKIPVEQSVNVLNMAQTSNFAFAPRDQSPIKLPDGRYYQAFSFYGTFSANGLDFRRFPFETLRFPLTFSLNPEFPALSADRVRLMPDRAESALGEFADLPGYSLIKHEILEFTYQFRTRFGLPVRQAIHEIQFSRVQMDVVYRTSVIAAALQLFLPLTVIMIIVLMTPNLAGSFWEVRIALPSTALLTLIFLQQGYSSQLPPLPYLTFIDQVYTLCYAVALAIFSLFVWSSNKYDLAENADRPAVVERINRVDRFFQVGLTVGLVLFIALSWFFPVR